MEENQQVLEIQNVLVEKSQDMEYAPIFLFNQAGEVVGDDLEAPVKDVFKSGDTVIAYIGTAAPPEVQNKGKFVKKDITNKSGVEVRVVMTTRWLRQKVCFPDKRLYSIDFCKWSKTIEVYWYLVFIFSFVDLILCAGQLRRNSRVRRSTWEKCTTWKGYI